jgi:glycosyltransferase involved in cell wall biosynthesis
MACVFRESGIPTIEFDRRWAVDIPVIYKLTRLIRRLQPDVIHTWNHEAAMYGIAAAQCCGVRRIVAGMYRLENWMGQRPGVVRLLSRAAVRTVAASRHVNDWYQARGLSSEPLTVIPPGVPPAAPSDVSREQLLRELSLPTNARLIGVVGRLVPENRVKDLIWAADLLRVLHDNLRLLVIGDGPLRVQLEQYARLASDLEHVQFLGERGDTWRIMPHLDVLWNASENRRLSIAILEAMAAGVPVVASDTPLNRELVVEGETGYLVPMLERSGRAERARHTDRVFSDSALASRLAENGRRRIAALFDADQMVQRYCNLYQTAMQ